MQVNLIPGSAAAVRGMSAVPLNNQALVLDRQGDHVGAERLHQQALAIKIDGFGENSVQTAITLNALGEVQLKLGKLEEAEAHLKRAIAVRNALGFASFDAAVSRENLAQVLETKGDLQGAKDIRMTGAPQSMSCGNYTCPGQTFTVTQLFVCSKCKSVFYCSTQCQRKDWSSRHKRFCKKA